MLDIEADKMLETFHKQVIARQNLKSLSGESASKEKGKRGVSEEGEIDKEEQQTPFKPSVEK